jgi:hypothetical protein
MDSKHFKHDAATFQDFKVDEVHSEGLTILNYVIEQF